MKLLEYHRLHAEEIALWNLQALEQAARGADATFPERLKPLLPDAPFPDTLLTFNRSPLFERLLSLGRLYRNATTAQRTYTRASLDWKAGGRLQSFGLRAAVLGVREQSPRLLRLALAAFAAADIGPDVRDTLISVALVFHCANRCGTTALALFPEAAAISGPAMSAVLLDYLSRPPGLQTLGCMGWNERNIPAGLI